MTNTQITATPRIQDYYSPINVKALIDIDGTVRDLLRAYFNKLQEKIPLKITFEDFSREYDLVGLPDGWNNDNIKNYIKYLLKDNSFYHQIPEIENSWEALFELESMDTLHSHPFSFNFNFYSTDTEEYRQRTEKWLVQKAFLRVEGPMIMRPDFVTEENAISWRKEVISAKCKHGKANIVFESDTGLVNGLAKEYPGILFFLFTHKPFWPRPNVRIYTSWDENKIAGNIYSFFIHRA